MSEFNSASRRNFLKTTAATALTASVLANGARLHGAYAGGDDVIKIGLIGCGGRGTDACKQALSTDGRVQLVAMADAFEDRMKNSYNDIKGSFEMRPDRVAVDPERMFVGFDGYKKVIASDVDLVILTTPPGFRPIHLKAAIEANKHVFMEKPVAVDAPGVRMVLDAVKLAKEKNRAIGVGLQRHHDPRYIETIKRLQDGAIGEIHTARAYWNNDGVWVRGRKPGQGEMDYQMRNWYYFTWLSGDHICEQHIHNLDVINWVKNGYPISAQGMGGREVRKELIVDGKWTNLDFGEIFDHHFIEYEYADGSRMFSQCRHQKSTWSSVSEHVQGTKGKATISGFNIVAGAENWTHPDSRQPRGKNAKGINPYQIEHDDLFASIRAGKPINEGENGAYSTMTAILGRMASYGGKVVKWDDALASKIDLMPTEFSFSATPKVVPDANGRYPIAIPGVTKVV